MAMHSLPWLLAAALQLAIPLLETDQEQIWQIPAPRGAPADWVWTQRHRKDGSGRWTVIYQLDCRQRRLRRLSEPLAPGGGPAQLITPGDEAGDWFGEKPFTLGSRLLARSCPKGGRAYPQQAPP
jgi:hypothetical protein